VSCFTQIVLFIVNSQPIPHPVSSDQPFVRGPPPHPMDLFPLHVNVCLRVRFVTLARNINFDSPFPPLLFPSLAQLIICFLLFQFPTLFLGLPLQRKHHPFYKEQFVQCFFHLLPLFGDFPHLTFLWVRLFAVRSDNRLSKARFPIPLTRKRVIFSRRLEIGPGTFGFGVLYFLTPIFSRSPPLTISTDYFELPDPSTQPVQPLFIIRPLKINLLMPLN